MIDLRLGDCLELLHDIPDGSGERDVWRIKPINYTSKNKLHNAQKPVELCEKMILSSSKEGDLVLDTFAGSGTTGVACINTGRNFIGMEISERYYNIAQKRLDEAQEGNKYER